MHHRFPTSTANVRNACHPFSTKDFFENNYVAVHNGVVHNTLELRELHEKLGIEYVSKQDSGRFNDSEALAYDLALYLEGFTTKLTARGSIAFIIIKRDSAGKPLMMFFGRNSNSPLKMKKTKHSLTLSSEGEGDVVEVDKLYSYSYDTGELVKRSLIIPGGWKPQTNPHYTRPTGVPTSTTPSTNGSTPLSTPTSAERIAIMDAIEKSSIRNGWDAKEEMKKIEERWDDIAGMQGVYDDLLREAAGDLGVALVGGETMLRNLQKRMTEIEDEEEEAETMSDNSRADLIEEYCEVEDCARNVSMALKKIREELIDAAEQKREEDSGANRVGFQHEVRKPIVPETGQRHPVPAIRHQQKLLEGRDYPRYAD